MTQNLRSVVVLLGGVVAMHVVGCGPAATGDPQDMDPIEPTDRPPNDMDGDGVAPPEDCNDEDSRVYGGAVEHCDGLDEDCSGWPDDPYDIDRDGRTVCAGDCDDEDENVYPGAPETANGKDDNCDGFTDNRLPDYDDDGDGFAETAGDCDDEEPLVNPGAVEVDAKTDGTPEGVDNDCDGATDEGTETCDTGLVATSATSYAQAMELCRWVSSASFNSGSNEQQRSLQSTFGASYVPSAGVTMAVLSTGIAAAGGMPQPGTMFLGTGSHPDPHADPADGCGQADPTLVQDMQELILELDVPSNAHSFSFDFNFMSAEYPEYVCSLFDDTFVAYLDSTSYTGNVSYDAMGKPVSINIAFFTVCPTGSGSTGCTGDAPLMGTGYEGTTGGGTGWLTTTAPVTPGEHVSLRFMIFDEGDWQLDSTVLLDNFRWQAEGVEEPVTIPRVVPKAPRFPY